MENKNLKESKYVCFSCNYKTNKHSDWEKHLKTAKHLKNCELDNKILKHFDNTNHTENILADKKYYVCNCGKKYLYKK